MNANLNTAKPYFREPQSGPTLNVLGVTHTSKATGAETAGAFSLREALIPPGIAVPAHTHANEDEAFYVLSGELLVEVEGESAPRRVAPGGFFFGARGRRHAFCNAGRETARVLVFNVPGDLDQMFVEIDALAANGTWKPADLAAISARYGITMEPPTAQIKAD